MSQIKPLAPKNCPNCGAEDSLFLAVTDRRLTCGICGHKVGDELPSTDTELTDLEAQRAQKKWVVTYGLDHVGDVDNWAKSKYHTALALVDRGEYDEAVKTFKVALEYQRDFLDAHLWIGRLTLDLDEKRDAYSEVLAYMPNHIEAMRELMILNGQLSTTEGARAGDASHSPNIQAVGAPVGVQQVEIVCSVCGSDMVSHPESGLAICPSCGHREQLTRQKDYGIDNLAMAVLKQRGQAIEWQVGKHILHCNNCGAERIISGQLRSECPYCGSDHVIELDALDSFRQPDGVVPFKIQEDEAHESLMQALNSRMERFKSFFVNNKAVHIGITASYLPVWYFDSVLDVIRTTHSNSTRNMNAQYQRETLTEMAHDVPIVATDSPPRKLVDKLGKFDLERVVTYEPNLLASYNAQIYTLDFQPASLMARESISKMMRRDYNHSEYGETRVTVSSMIKQMMFRLVLVPVWTGTIIEDDGDVRLGVIHGETGKVALGKAQKIS